MAMGEKEHGLRSGREELDRRQGGWPRRAGHARAGAAPGEGSRGQRSWPRPWPVS
jgi:hypothetical protein